MDLGVLADAVLALLLIVTIAYAVILNRKLAALRDTKDQMAGLLAEFARTTAQAEAGVKELRDRAAASGDGLSAIVAEAGAKLEKAGGLKEDLAFLIEKGEALADRLERGLEGGRGGQARPRAGGAGKAAAKAEPAEDEALKRSLAGVR
ncbi:hypothetical protein SAMN06265365_12425 [Tistlia consotensis]|uniref:DUF6468 domain-containing protein n=1 Tax=Tistlia consotensis USBA 355 TaxID=560819 RepID=A0A1Y6CK52_9PROT|nr:DUF6468 domain-containing protein [Tistlia consotensis]SMF67994.1 hypothetical protein SAMN05428998_12780 [Tistlia consotensis USBA 355]SNR99203.1 hypothetical protein SAMN06265365_12425 [Tistlia consotensis]